MSLILILSTFSRQLQVRWTQLSSDLNLQNSMYFMINSKTICKRCNSWYNSKWNGNDNFSVLYRIKPRVGLQSERNNISLLLILNTVSIFCVLIMSQFLGICWHHCVSVLICFYLPLLTQKFLMLNSCMILEQLHLKTKVFKLRVASTTVLSINLTWVIWHMIYNKNQGKYNYSLFSCC